MKRKYYEKMGFYFNCGYSFRRICISYGKEVIGTFTVNRPGIITSQMQEAMNHKLQEVGIIS